MTVSRHILYIYTKTIFNLWHVEGRLQLPGAPLTYLFACQSHTAPEAPFVKTPPFSSRFVPTSYRR